MGCITSTEKIFNPSSTPSLGPLHEMALEI